MAKNLSSKTWWRAAQRRAVRTIAQTLAGQIPVGFLITPVMIQNADWSYLQIFLAWLLTGIAAGVLSILTSLGGLPEVDEVE